ncbi:MAG TPA: rhomboid family intramembrane serine protease [Flavisolibacter sp.]|nr:rhomboid family intramembrane serine protease [Flavisolibacter sp.]
MSQFKYTRPDSFPPIVKNLIIINVLVFVAQLTLGITDKLMLYPLLPEAVLDRLQEANIKEFANGSLFQPYQIATHMFSHSPSMIFHIVFNMFALWMFGRVLENVWGPQRFLLFYFLCGIGSAALHLIIQYISVQNILQFSASEINSGLGMGNPEVVKSVMGAAVGALGASGAVMGILVGFAFLFPNTELFIMFIPFPIKAKWLVLGYIAIDLFGGFGVYNSNIAHFAHLGGALTGFIIVLIWNKKNKRHFY